MFWISAPNEEVKQRLPGFMKYLADISVIRDLTDRLNASTYWKDVGWLSSGTLVANAIMLATMPVFSRIFSPADFGVQNLFIQFAGFYAVVATLRYEYFVQLPKQDDDALLFVQLVAILGFFNTLVMTPVLWLLRDIISRLAGDSALSIWLVFIPVTAAAISLAIALQGWAQRQLLFQRSGEAEVVGKASYSITTLVGWFFFQGAGGLVMSYLGAALGKIFWLSRGVRYTSCAKYSHFILMVRAYMRMAVSLALSHALLACTVAIPSVFISRNYGSEILGQYALSSLVVSFPTSLLGNAIGNVYYQRSSECWAKGFSFGDIWQSTAKSLLLIGIPLYGTAILISPWLFPLLFGDAWAPAGHYGAVLAISAFFSFATSPMDKGFLVVRAWFYPFLWHAGRVLTTAMVVGMALFFEWSMDVFISILVIQQTALYLIDYCAEWHFAHREPSHTARKGGSAYAGL